MQDQFRKPKMEIARKIILTRKAEETSDVPQTGSYGSFNSQNAIPSNSQLPAHSAAYTSSQPTYSTSQTTTYTSNQTMTYTASQPKSYTSPQPTTYTTSQPRTYLSSQQSNYQTSDGILYTPSQPATYTSSHDSSYPVSQPKTYSNSYVSSTRPSDLGNNNQYIQSQPQSISQTQASPGVTRVTYQSNSTNIHEVDNNYGLSVKVRGSPSGTSATQILTEQPAGSYRYSEERKPSDSSSSISHFGENLDRKTFNSDRGFNSPTYVHNPSSYGTSSFRQYNDQKPSPIHITSNFNGSSPVAYTPPHTSYTSTFNTVNYAPAITSHTVINQIQTTLPPNFSVFPNNIQQPEPTKYQTFEPQVSPQVVTKPQTETQKNILTFDDINQTLERSKKLAKKEGAKLETHEVKIEGVGVYKGEILNGEMHGFGELFDEEGRQVYKGQFVKGQFEGQGTMHNSEAESTLKESDFKTFDLNVLKDSWVKYEGAFKGSTFHGYGALYFPYKLYFMGEFFEGEANGYGVVVLPNGKKVCGIWKKNAFVQKV